MLEEEIKKYCINTSFIRINHTRVFEEIDNLIKEKKYIQLYDFVYDLKLLEYDLIATYLNKIHPYLIQGIASSLLISDIAKYIRFREIILKDENITSENIFKSLKTKVGLQYLLENVVLDLLIIENPSLIQHLYNLFPSEEILLTYLIKNGCINVITEYQSLQLILGNINFFIVKCGYKKVRIVIDNLERLKTKVFKYEV